MPPPFTTEKSANCPETGLASLGRAADARVMEPPPWLSDILELAELLLRLHERENPAAEAVLKELDHGEITLREAVKKLRQLH